MKRATLRFAVGAVSRATTRVETKLPFRIATQSNATFQPGRVALVSSVRCYATPSKPKKGSIGESSSRASTRPRKTEEQKAQEKQAKEDRAAKAKERAALKAQKEAERTQKQEARKLKQDEKKQKPKKKKAAAKKPATKKKAAGAKKRAKTPLTEEQIARKKSRTEKEDVRKLKELALSPPPRGQYSAWIVVNTEFANKAQRERDPGANSRDVLTAAVKEAVARYRSLSPSEHEHYNHLANQRTEEKEQAYKAWLQEHTPEQIRIANSARSKLRAKLSKGTHKWIALKDDRLVPTPRSAYILFSTDRHNSGDLKGIPLSEAGKLVGEEWKKLDESEKQEYFRRGEQESDRYAQQYLSVYGHEPTAKPAVTIAAE